MDVLELATPPASEPVTLAEAKAHLRLEIDDDDALVAGLITALITALAIWRRGDRSGIPVDSHLDSERLPMVADAPPAAIPSAHAAPRLPDDLEPHPTGMFAALGRFDVRRPFAPWLHRIAVNRALDLVRRERRLVALDAVEERGSGLAAAGEGRVEGADADLLRALDGLGHRRRRRARSRSRREPGNGHRLDPRHR